MSDQHRIQAVQDWAAELARALEIEDTPVDTDAILGIAGEAAHSVVRPAAPMTTFLIGYAAGLAEATGQADFSTAQHAATGVARRLLAARDAAQGMADSAEE
ncbi:DUF6457 domain-containing protein [Nesterenkonia ebinurensis]|uniref:DUF6457 domain-containing protein n=1 Tax=Nesterenkonia ebinurensis TaxID=2608252 RepID=UPI00123D429F|nr:DUF6457 domain-containing protein [Nesterenkonia ebinurensis]